MTHIGIVEQVDGKSTDWMEKVTDAQYGAAVATQTPAAAGPARTVAGGSDRPTAAQRLLGDIAPKLADLQASKEAAWGPATKCLTMKMTP